MSHSEEKIRQIKSSFKLVHIDNPLQRWEEPLVQDLFGKLSTLRIRGYGKKYPNGVVPLDTSCWFASQFLVCAGSRRLEPVLSLQRTTLKRYRDHHCQFSPLAMCLQDGSPAHIDAMQKLVSRFEHMPDKLSYTGGFTIAPDLRTDRDLVKELCRLMVVLHYLIHKEAGEQHEFVTATSMRFKIDKLLHDYGFMPLLSANGGGDDSLSLTYLAGERARFMQAQSFNQKMVELAEKYGSWWNDRLSIGGGVQGEEVRQPVPALVPHGLTALTHTS